MLWIAISDGSNHKKYTSSHNVTGVCKDDVSVRFRAIGYRVFSMLQHIHFAKLVKALAVGARPVAILVSEEDPKFVTAHDLCPRCGACCIVMGIRMVHGLMK